MVRDVSVESSEDAARLATGESGRAASQLDRLRGLVQELLVNNSFWAPRLRQAGLDGGVESLEHFTGALPRVEKIELIEDQRVHPPYGLNVTYPLDRYTRLHQTSGTSGGTPLRWLDTPESWSAQLATWRRVLTSCGLSAADRVFFPFSFGPFLGFWTAFEAASELGCLVLPGGGLSSRGRLDMLLANDATALCCTPTYALRLGEVAAEAGLDLGRGDAAPRTLIVAGEPGGSIPEVQTRIAQLWGGARVFDHHGMTEVGPVSYPDPNQSGVLRVDGDAFFAEVLKPDTGEAVDDGELGELVLTTLRRRGTPLLRYRTGDLVRRAPPPDDRPGDIGLEGGVLARTDDMVVVRGVNLYPSAVDRVVRRFDGVAEYRVELRRDRGMAELTLEVEPQPGVAPGPLASGLGDSLRAAFNLRIPVTAAEVGSLPRFELKARRWHWAPR
ncbi:MAG: AMP-binding protein [Acidobacteriota bacterium]